MRRPCLLLATLLSASCTFSQVVGDLDRKSPPPDLGRPGWVRYSARVGAWLGGAVGAVASIATLPLTWPISLLAEEPLGLAKQEFMWWGVSAGASTGHFALGAPTDTMDYLFRRAWTEQPRPTDYEFEPMPPSTFVREDDAAAEPPPGQVQEPTGQAPAAEKPGEQPGVEPAKPVQPQTERRESRDGPP